MHWRLANEVARIEAKYPNGLSSRQQNIPIYSITSLTLCPQEVQ